MRVAELSKPHMGQCIGTTYNFGAHVASGWQCCGSRTTQRALYVHAIMSYCFEQMNDRALSSICLTFSPHFSRYTINCGIRWFLEDAPFSFEYHEEFRDSRLVTIIKMNHEPELGVRRANVVILDNAIELLDRWSRNVCGFGMYVRTPVDDVEFQNFVTITPIEAEE